jgi:site-specific DNA-methyltransferase (adenine-specific)
MEDRFQMMLGDCLGVMDSIDDGMVDMVLCDLPYGITSCKWDSVIPLADLWAQYERVTKSTAIIALTASQPFTSALVMSKPEWFKHEWIWIKNRGSNFANTVREPMKEHESVLIFCRKGPWTYNKQMQERTGTGGDRVKYGVAFQSKSENYREFEGRPHTMLPELRVPSSWQKFNTEVGLHPTQKPVPLMEYLIRTYSHENEIVLDNTMGSGTTGVACLNLNRKFIGIESDLKYFQAAKIRLEAHYSAGIPRAGFREEGKGLIGTDDELQMRCSDEK